MQLEKYLPGDFDTTSLLHDNPFQADVENPVETSDVLSESNIRRAAMVSLSVIVVSSILLCATFFLSMNTSFSKLLGEKSLEFETSTANELLIPRYYLKSFEADTPQARSSARISAHATFEEFKANGLVSSPGEGWTAFPSEEDKKVFNNGGWTAFPTEASEWVFKNGGWTAFPTEEINADRDISMPDTPSPFGRTFSPSTPSPTFPVPPDGTFSPSTALPSYPHPPVYPTDKPTKIVEPSPSPTEELKADHDIPTQDVSSVSPSTAGPTFPIPPDGTFSPSTAMPSYPRPPVYPTDKPTTLVAPSPSPTGWMWYY